MIISFLDFDTSETLQRTQTDYYVWKLREKDAYRLGDGLFSRFYTQPMTKFVLHAVINLRLRVHNHAKRTRRKA